MRKVTDLELADKLADKFMRYKSGELSSLATVILVNEHLNQFVNALRRGSPLNETLELAALECDKLSAHEGNEYLKANPHNTFSSSVAVDVARFLATKIRNLKGDAPMSRANETVTRSIPSDACPFCGEDDFDGPSLAGHIANDCEPATKSLLEFQELTDDETMHVKHDPCPHPWCGGWMIFKDNKTRCNSCDMVLADGPIITGSLSRENALGIGLLGLEMPIDTPTEMAKAERINEIERRILKIEEWIQP